MTIAPTPLYEHAYLGTTEGAWFTLPLNFDDILEAHTAGEDDIDIQDAVVLTGAPTNPSFQYGLSMGSCSVPCLPWLATAGHDGILRVWNTQSFDLLSRVSFNAFSPAVPLTSIASGSSTATPLIAVGSAAGILRVVMVEDRESGASLEEKKAALGDGAAKEGKEGEYLSETAVVRLLNTSRIHKGAITSLVFHPKLPLVASASTQDSCVFVIDVRVDGNFRVLCYAKMPEGEGNAPLALAWRGNRGLVVATFDGALYRIDSPRPSEGVVRTSFAHLSFLFPFVSFLSFGISLLGNGPLVHSSFSISYLSHLDKTG